MILKPYNFLNSNNYLTKRRKPFEKKYINETDKECLRWNKTTWCSMVAW
jgi:hypothetical protein